MGFVHAWPQNQVVKFWHAAAQRAVRSSPLKRFSAALAVTHPKKQLGRLTRRTEFLYVREGAYRAIGGIVIQARPNPDHQHIRVGFTATKKIGNAVVRNRAKRRLREAARTLLPQHGLPGHDYVLIARNSTTARDWSDLLDDTRKALITLSKRAIVTTGQPHKNAQSHKVKSQSS